jgi:hypothetical protein
LPHGFLAHLGLAGSRVCSKGARKLPSRSDRDGLQQDSSWRH